jgi:hypothetical protein
VIELCKYESENIRSFLVYILGLYKII